VATLASASLGHDVNQSMVVQLTREGKLDRRSLNASPTGLKLNTTCRLRRTCRIFSRGRRHTTHCIWDTERIGTYP
jgi:hypothetical protein